jgi:hypothetical protein
LAAALLPGKSRPHVIADRSRDRRRQGDSATSRIEHGWPRDAFLAKGTIGQYVIVIPSERLVIVRLGTSPNWPFNADGVSRLVSDVVAATGKGHVAAGN